MDLATDAILRMDETDLLELFSAEKFIASENGNYAEIENVARALGILK